MRSARSYGHQLEVYAAAVPRRGRRDQTAHMMRYLGRRIRCVPLGAIEWVFGEKNVNKQIRGQKRRNTCRHRSSSRISQTRNKSKPVNTRPENRHA